MSLLEGKTVSGRFSIDWTKTIERLKIPHRKQICLDCDNGEICSDGVIKPKMKCFNCEMESTCRTCLDRISQKKTFSIDFNMLNRKLANEYYQTFLYYEGKYETQQITLILNLQEKF